MPNRTLIAAATEHARHSPNVVKTFIVCKYVHETTVNMLSKRCHLHICLLGWLCTSARPYIHTLFHKQFFFQFERNLICRKRSISATRKHAVWDDPRWKSRSRRSEMCQKWPISKAISTVNMHVIKRLMVNYDTSRQHQDFNWTDFFIFVLVRHHMTFKLRVMNLWQTNFASYKKSTGRPTPGLFICN